MCKWASTCILTHPGKRNCTLAKWPGEYFVVSMFQINLRASFLPSTLRHQHPHIQDDFSKRAVPAVTTFMLRGSLLCFGGNRYRLMKTKHFKLKALTAWLGLSDLRSVMQDFILKYHCVTVSMWKLQLVTPPPSPPLPQRNTYSSPQFRGSLRKPSGHKCPNSECSWWENPLSSLNPLLVELPFTVVITPQAPLQLRLLCSTLPKRCKLTLHLSIGAEIPVYHTFDFISKC